MLDQIAILIRFVHFSASLTLFGAALFRLVLFPRGSESILSPGLHTLLKMLAALALTSGALWLAIESGLAGNGWADTINPSAIGTFLNETGFGRIWRWRLVLALLVLAAALADRPSLRSVLAVLAALQLGTLAMTGHAIMDEGTAGLTHEINQAIHLLAAGSWLGGLLAIVPLVTRKPISAEKECTRALRRFTGLGAVAVALVLISGLINVRFMVPDISALADDAYGRMLLVKLLLVAAMVVLALINRFILLPDASIAPARTLARLRRTVTAELSLGALAVATVSVLGTLQPPR